METRVVAKAALFDEHGKVLILRRSMTDDRRPGGLDFPGGRPDGDESPKQAVIREIQEEIGCSMLAAEVNLAFTDTDYFEDRSWIRFLFIGRLPADSRIALSHEHDEYRWMGIDEAIEKFDHPIWSEGLAYIRDHHLS